MAKKKQEKNINFDKHIYDKMKTLKTRINFCVVTDKLY